MENFHYLDNEIMSMVVVAQGMNTEEKTTEMEILRKIAFRLRTTAQRMSGKQAVKKKVSDKSQTKFNNLQTHH